MKAAPFLDLSYTPPSTKPPVKAAPPRDTICLSPLEDIENIPQDENIEASTPDVGVDGRDISRVNSILDVASDTPDKVSRRRSRLGLLSRSCSTPSIPSSDDDEVDFCHR